MTKGAGRVFRPGWAESVVGIKKSISESTHSEAHKTDQMKKSVTFLICLLAAAFAPLVIPFTGGWLFFVLHEWFYPSVWGLPPLQSLIGVSINCTAVGYFFTWFYALPLVFILKRLNRYRLRYLLVVSTLPALSLPFWQVDWTISILPVLIAGMSTAYVFWRLTNLGVAQLTRVEHRSGH